MHLCFSFCAFSLIRSTASWISWQSWVECRWWVRISCINWNSTEYPGVWTGSTANWWVVQISTWGRCDMLWCWAPEDNNLYKQSGGYHLAHGELMASSWLVDFKEGMAFRKTCIFLSFFSQTWVINSDISERIEPVERPRQKIMNSRMISHIIIRLRVTLYHPWCFTPRFSPPMWPRLPLAGEEQAQAEAHDPISASGLGQGWRADGSTTIVLLVGCLFGWFFGLDGLMLDGRLFVWLVGWLVG